MALKRLTAKRIVKEHRGTTSPIRMRCDDNLDYAVKLSSTAQRRQKLAYPVLSPFDRRNKFADLQ